MVYINQDVKTETNKVLVPFDFGVVYILVVANSTTTGVLVPFDFGVVYIKYQHMTNYL